MCTRALRAPEQAPVTPSRGRYNALKASNGFLTPDLWAETRFAKPPAQEFTDLLAKPDRKARDY